MKFKYNLQFFAEGDGGNDNGSTTSGNSDNAAANSTDGSGVDNGNNGDDKAVDLEAFADLLSEKDKKLEQLEAEIKQLKKSNAELIVQVSAGAKQNTKSFDENLLALCGATPRKE